MIGRVCSPFKVLAGVDFAGALLSRGNAGARWNADTVARRGWQIIGIMIHDPDDI